MDVLVTPRLRLRHLTLADAPFIQTLLNEPAFRQHIGDRRIRTPSEAEVYLQRFVLPSYTRHGFGMYAMTERSSSLTVGICGLIKRDPLPHPDLGFALLERYWRRGYAKEAATSLLHLAQNRFGLRRLLALASGDNAASIRLLEKLGFEIDRPFTLPNATVPTHLFVRRESLWHRGSG